MGNWMEGLVAEKYQKKWNLAIFIFIIIYGLFYFLSRKDLKKEIYKEVLNDSYSGKVIKKYLNNKEHNYPTLILQNDSLLQTDQKCYDKIDLGDSIAKNKGSFNFIIYKPKDTVIIDTKKLLDAAYN